MTQQTQNKQLPKEEGIREIILKNNLIRYKILEFLYLLNQEEKFARLGWIINKTNYSKEEIKPNLRFLKTTTDVVESINSFAIVV